MSHIWIFAPASVFVAVLAYGDRKRLSAALLVLLTIYIGVVDLMGRAKPARIEMLHDLGESEVLWFSASEAEGIHVLLAGPRLYSIPWSERLARELHEGSRKAEAEGGTVRLGKPRDGTAGGEWSAGWAPPPAPVPKG